MACKSSKSTPTAPIHERHAVPASVEVLTEGKQVRTRATLYMVRPGLGDYVIKG